MRQIATDGRITCSEYKTGLIVHWPIVPAARLSGERNPRGIIRDMSGKARRACAFVAGNLPRDWGAMFTLTVRDAPERPKVLKEKWLRKWAEKCGTGVQWLIIMEFTLRGRCHWHFFVEKPWVDARLASGDAYTETLVRRGQAVEVLRGPLEEWTVETWTSIVGDDSLGFRRFQRGGIIELLRHPDAAARYVAKECSKRVQKQLPPGVDPQGAWWGYNKRFKPSPIGLLTLEKWPYDRIYGLIFDKSDALKREKSTTRERSLVVTTSYNVCVAKTRDALRRKSESAAEEKSAQPAGMKGLDSLHPQIPDDLLGGHHFGNPDCR